MLSRCSVLMGRVARTVFRKACAFASGSASVFAFLFLVTISPFGDGSWDLRYFFSDAAVEFHHLVTTPLGPHVVTVSVIAGLAIAIFPNGEGWESPIQIPFLVFFSLSSFFMIFVWLYVAALCIQPIVAVYSILHLPPSARYDVPNRACNARDLAEATRKLYGSQSTAQLAVAVVGPKTPNAHFTHLLGDLRAKARKGESIAGALSVPPQFNRMPLPALDLVEAITHPNHRKPPEPAQRYDPRPGGIRVLFLQGTQFARGRDTGTWADVLAFSGFETKYQHRIEVAALNDKNGAIPLIAVGHSLGGMIASRANTGAVRAITFGSPYGPYYRELSPASTRVRSFAISGDVVPALDELRAVNIFAKSVFKGLHKATWLEVLENIATINEVRQRDDTQWLPNDRSGLSKYLPVDAHLQYAESRALTNYDVFGDRMTEDPANCLWFVSSRNL